METKKQTIGLSVNFNIPKDKLDLLIKEFKDSELNNLYDEITVFTDETQYDNLDIEELEYLKSEL